MSIDTEKICRTCLGLSGPLLSIFDGSSVGGCSFGCVADMLGDFTRIKPKQTDNMPAKVCLSCISELNRCYSFKMKCENANNTLRQLLPNAVDLSEEEEEGNLVAYAKAAVVMLDKGVQTEEAKKEVASIKIQTMSELKCQDQEVQTEQNAYSTSQAGNRDVSNQRSSFCKKDGVPEDNQKRVQAPSENGIPQNQAFRQLHLVEMDETSDDQIIVELRNECEQEEMNSVEDCSEVMIHSDYDDTEATHYVLSDTQLVENDENEHDDDNDDGDDRRNELMRYESECDMRISISSDCETSENQNYSFTIIHSTKGHEEVASSKTMTATTRANQKPTAKRIQTKMCIVSRDVKVEKDVFTCPNCLLSFANVNTLKQHHCLQTHHSSKLPAKDSANIKAPSAKMIVADEEEEQKEEEEDEELPNDENTMMELGEDDLSEDIQATLLQQLQDEQIGTVEMVDTEISRRSDNVKASPAALHVPNAPTVYCPLCNAGFAYRKSLNYHLKQNQCTAQTFKCEECQRVFTSRDGLDKHYETHLLQHTCNECQHVFESKEELSEHLIEKHDRSAKNQCNVCKKVFTMVSALKDHLRIHSGQKPFPCDICGKAFRQRSNLKQHVMRHSNIKPFRCEYCALSFVSKAELSSHKLTHTGDHPFKCEICSASYTTSSSLAKHRRKHTGERPYACEFCPMRFSALNVLKNHRRTHTGEKPYSCVFCNKAFTQKSDCQIHQRMHTGEKRYTCKCGAAFTQYTAKRAHQKLQGCESESSSRVAAHKGRRSRKTKGDTREEEEETIQNSAPKQQQKTRTVSLFEADESSLHEADIDENCNTAEVKEEDYIQLEDM